MRWDHPRWRGKDKSNCLRLKYMQGSPPLARERHIIHFRNLFSIGITPAGAGKTLPKNGSLVPEEDHPRWRGKDNTKIRLVSGLSGSPPLARERHGFLNG